MKEKKIEGALVTSLCRTVTLTSLWGTFADNKHLQQFAQKPITRQPKQATPVSSSVACEVEKWQAEVEDRVSGEPGLAICSPSSY